MSISRQSLNIDLDQLFPGEPVEIGNQSIIIRPLSISQIATLSKKVKGLGSLLSEEGVTWDNYNDPDSLFKISVIIIDNFSDILEEASNVDIEALQALPLEAVVKIVDAIISVNLKSKDSLEKNFKSLAERFLTKKGTKEPQSIPTKKKK